MLPHIHHQGEIIADRNRIKGANLNPNPSPFTNVNCWGRMSGLGTGTPGWGETGAPNHLFDEENAICFTVRLFAIATLRDNLLGQGVSTEATYFRNEAFRLIIDWLKKEDEWKDPTTIYAIMMMGATSVSGASLAFPPRNSSRTDLADQSLHALQASIGEVEQAVMHFQAARRLINMRGGLSTFPIGFRRIAIWSVQAPSFNPRHWALGHVQV